MPNVISQLDC